MHTDPQDLPATTLPQNIRLALVSPADAPALAGAYQRNRNYLAPWVHNAVSQRVLQRSGFDRIGLAPQYLKIAGRWQDHLLFQRILEAQQCAR